VYLIYQLIKKKIDTRHSIAVKRVSMEVMDACIVAMDACIAVLVVCIVVMDACIVAMLTFLWCGRCSK
jgi:hypothetical protein